MNKKDNFENLTAFDGGIAFFAMVGLYFFISIFGQLFAEIICKYLAIDLVAITSTFAPLAMLLVVIYFKRKKKSPFVALCNVNKFDCRYLLLSVLLSVGMFFGLGFLNSVVIGFLNGLGFYVHPISVSIFRVWDLLYYSVFLALIPAVVEELFFRGLLIGSLKNSKTVWVVLVISLCFALYHCSVAQLLYQLIYGAGLVLLCKASKSVIPCMVSHFINNFVVLLFEYLQLNVDLYNLVFIIFGLITLAVFFVLCYKSINKQALSQKTEHHDSVKAFLLPGGVMAFVLLSVVIISGLIVG